MIHGYLLQKLVYASTYPKIPSGDFSRISHIYDAQVNIGSSGKIIVCGGFHFKTLQISRGYLSPVFRVFKLQVSSEVC